ncbi:Uncharacterised protein [Vibrio cholerae]|nr:Uncharacterised protein [Vibrio cholerae]
MEWDRVPCGYHVFFFQVSKRWVEASKGIEVFKYRFGQVVDDRFRHLFRGD